MSETNFGRTSYCATCQEQLKTIEAQAEKINRLREALKKLYDRARYTEDVRIINEALKESGYGA